MGIHETRIGPLQFHGLFALGYFQKDCLALNLWQNSLHLNLTKKQLLSDWFYSVFERNLRLTSEEDVLHNYRSPVRDSGCNATKH